MKEFNLPNINYHGELSKCKTMDDLVGRNGHRLHRTGDQP